MRAVALIAALSIPLSSLADETSRNQVIRAAVRSISRSTKSDQLHPLLVSATTTGGAEHFVSQWTADQYGSAIGQEMGKDFVEKNRSGHDLQTQFLLPIEVANLDQYKVGDSYDWDALEKAYPGFRAVANVSEPGFDSIESNAIVRIDVLTPKHSETHVIAVEHQPTGTWQLTKGAIGTYESFHRTDTYLHPPQHH